MTLLYIGIAIASFGLVVDHWSTMWGLGHGAREKNPLGRWILANCYHLVLPLVNAALLGAAFALLTYAGQGSLLPGSIMLMVAGALKTYVAWRNVGVAKAMREKNR